MTDLSPKGRLRRRCIVVTGMHRSGTSALARVVNLLGAALPDRLVGPDEGNPLGHWEPARVVALNDELLNQLCQGWDDIAAIDWNGTSADWFAGAVSDVCDALQADFADASLFVVKDPRISRMLPIWRAAFERLGVEPLLVHCVRDPFEVAQSLKTRDGMTRSYALLLWARHTLDCHIHGRGLRRMVLTYSDLLKDWRGSIAGLETAMGLTLPVSAAAEAEISAFLTPDMRHHRRDPHQAAPSALSETIAAIVAAIEENRLDNEGLLERLKIQLDLEASNPRLLRKEIAARTRRARQMRAETTELRSYIGRIQPEVEQLRALISDRARTHGGMDVGAELQAAINQGVTSLRHSLREEIAALLGDAAATQLAGLQEQLGAAIAALGRGVSTDAEAPTVPLASPLSAIQATLAAIEGRVVAMESRTAVGQSDVRLHEERALLLAEALDRARAEARSAQAQVETLISQRAQLQDQIANQQEQRDLWLAEAQAQKELEQQLLTLQMIHDEALTVHARVAMDLKASQSALAATERRAAQLAADLNAATREGPTALDRAPSFGRDSTWRSLTAAPGAILTDKS